MSIAAAAAVGCCARARARLATEKKHGTVIGVRARARALVCTDDLGCLTAVAAVGWLVALPHSNSRKLYRSALAFAAHGARPLRRIIRPQPMLARRAIAPCAMAISHSTARLRIPYSVCIYYSLVPSEIQAAAHTHAHTISYAQDV